MQCSFTHVLAQHLATLLLSTDVLQLYEGRILTIQVSSYSLSQSEYIGNKRDSCSSDSLRFTPLVIQLVNLIDHIDVLEVRLVRSPTLRRSDINAREW